MERLYKIIDADRMDKLIKEMKVEVEVEEEKMKIEFPKWLFDNYEEEEASMIVEYVTNSFIENMKKEE